MTSMIYPTPKTRQCPKRWWSPGPEGPYIYDKQGERSLEGRARAPVVPALGYGNEEVIEAAERQMRGAGASATCSAARLTPSD
ncbi:MAG: hypothetical protein CM15mP103_05050 [Gammaproteobacteria bacterium]|nr:MAG: hypothetical protein CM15mP103_05050 [Gammaproteobacteria bacterium]